MKKECELADIEELQKKEANEVINGHPETFKKLAQTTEIIWDNVDPDFVICEACCGKTYGGEATTSATPSLAGVAMCETCNSPPEQYCCVSRQEGGYCECRVL